MFTDIFEESSACTASIPMMEAVVSSEMFAHFCQMTESHARIHYSWNI